MRVQTLSLISRSTFQTKQEIQNCTKTHYWLKIRLSLVLNYEDRVKAVPGLRLISCPTFNSKADLGIIHSVKLRFCWRPATKKNWKPFIIYWSITLEGRLAKKGLFLKLTLVIQLSMESVWSCFRISEMADMDSRTEVSREMSCPSIKAMFKSSSSTVFQNNILEDVLIKITHFPNKIYT